MATRTNEPLIVTEGGLEKDDALKAEKIRNDIAETRNHMARTVDAIEERLSPKNIKAQVSSVKGHLLEEVSSVKDHLLEEVSSTKTKLLEEIKDVKSTVQSEVSHGLDAAKEKVREQTIGRVENMVHGARTTMTHAGSTTVETVKTNPIPAALVAVGLGWLIVSGMKGRKASTVDTRINARSVGGNAYGGSYGPYGSIDGVDEDGYAYSYDQGVAAQNLASSDYGREERFGGPRRVINRGRRVVSNVGGSISNVGQEVAGKAKGVASSAQSAVTGAAHTVAEKAEHLAHDATTMAHDATNKVGMAAGQAKRKVGMVARNAGVQGRRVVRRAGVQARRVEQGFERELRENPLAIGAVAVAVGAAIGLLLPRTETEDRLLGEKKDMLLDTAKERVQGIAQQAISTVQEKAGELTSNLQGSQGSESKSEAQPYSNGLSHQNGLSNGLSNGFSKHV